MRPARDSVVVEQFSYEPSFHFFNGSLSRADIKHAQRSRKHLLKYRQLPACCPDNIVFDRKGNLWIATDGQPNSLKKNDGIYAVPVRGPDRGYVRQFLSACAGAEVASLAMTPDDRSLFAAIQHPGEGSKNLEPANLISRWPDGDFPRPSVVAVTKADIIGS